MKHKFAENLSRLMDERGLKQADLARLMGISPPRVFFLVRGKQEPKLSTVFHLMEVLECKFEELVDTTGEKR